MAQPKLPQKNPFISPFEQAGELAVDTSKKIVPELLKTFNPFSGMFETGTRHKEQREKPTNHTPLDFAKLQKTYAENDASQLDAIRKQFELTDEIKQPNEDALKLRRHRQFQGEQQQYYAKQDQEKEQQEQHEIAIKQQEEEQREKERAAQSASLPKGKKRINILGGGHKKASTDLPPEIRAERRPGSGKQ